MAIMGGPTRKYTPEEDAQILAWPGALSLKELAGSLNRTVQGIGVAPGQALEDAHS